MAHRLIFAASETFMNTKVKITERGQSSSNWYVTGIQADGSFILRKGSNGRVYQVRSWEGANECRATLVNTISYNGE